MCLVLNTNTQKRDRECDQINKNSDQRKFLVTGPVDDGVIEWDLKIERRK